MIEAPSFSAEISGDNNNDDNGPSRGGKLRGSPRRSSSADGVLVSAAGVSGGGRSSDHSGTPVAPLDLAEASTAAAKRTISSLKAEINGMAVKHKEEVYWLRLELDTTRREKEAIEDRITELYRDMQELLAADNTSCSGGSGVSQTLRGGKFGRVSDVNEMQKHLQKHEKMVIVMNNQIGLLRSSTDSLLKSLKDEISDLMDDKSRTELNLMNRMSELDKENRELKLRLEIAEQRQQPPPLSEVSQSPKANSGRTGRLPSSASSHRHMGASAEVKQLQDEIKSLRQQNRKKDQEAAKSQDSINKLEDDRQELSQLVDRIRQELEVARGTEASVRAREQLLKDREEASGLLDRVAQVWDQADESIRLLSGIVERLALPPPPPMSTAGPAATTSATSAIASPGSGDDPQSEDRDRALSVMETASLVHGQIKFSLMLVELKLRNNLACLRNDRAQLGSFVNDDDGASTDGGDVFEERLDLVRSEAMAAVDQLARTLDDRIARLEEQSEEVTATLTESIESRISELQRMQTRQTELYQMLTNLRESDQAETREVVNADGSVDVFVSRKVLESLQNEVLVIVDRMKEKNEEIVRLKATVDELKVRERAFMVELRRMMQEQSRIEMEERNRRMLAQAQQGDVDDDITDSDYEDCSSSAYEESHNSEDEEEESFLEETVADL